MACLIRHEARRLLALSDVDRLSAVKELREFDARHGKDKGAQLRAQIRELRQEVSS